MIKWFCDVCTKEILKPENPVSVKAYRCSKSRSDEQIGWGNEDDIIAVMCHTACADVLENEIQGALNLARASGIAR